ncbi:MAG: heat-inducible transcriptional repressor HrcA [Actinomycetota bacterium]
MNDMLGDRPAAILRAIVREYIRTGEAVGSKYLVDRTRLSVSPATVRNEMARLEELGFVVQPHTSAGRIPTDLGYRFVVDEIKAPRPLAEGQRRALEEELNGDEPASIEDLLRRASDVVSRFTHHAAAVLARRARPSTLRRLELFPMGARVAMVVLIAENGRVEQRMVPLDALLTDKEVEQLGERLANQLHGVTLDAAETRLSELARTEPAHNRALLENVAAACASLRKSDEHVFVGGVANLAGEETFERETLSRLYETLERQTAVLELLASTLDRPMSVRIGSELDAEDLRSCSVVVANFTSGTDAFGSVGVIGPTRMDYDRVIATANAVARMLEATLGAPESSS